ATISNVPYRSWSAYATVPTRAAEAGNLYTLAATATGTGTVAFSSTPNLPGIPETNSVSAQGGVQIPGSVLSAVLFPGVPADAPQATAGNANPAIVLFDERQFQ